MVKRKAVLGICAVILSLLLSGCGSKLREGEVYDKSFTPAYTQLMMMPMSISNGKSISTILIPFYVHHPDTWSVSIKEFREKDETWVTATYWVNQTVYDSVNIGDQFKYDENTCLEEAPYTRERAD